MVRDLPTVRHVRIVKEIEAEEVVVHSKTEAEDHNNVEGEYKFLPRISDLVAQKIKLTLSDRVCHEITNHIAFEIYSVLLTSNTCRIF